MIIKVAHILVLNTLQDYKMINKFKLFLLIVSLSFFSVSKTSAMKITMLNNELLTALYLANVNFVSLVDNPEDYSVMIEEYNDKLRIIFSQESKLEGKKSVRGNGKEQVIYSIHRGTNLIQSVEKKLAK